MRNPSRIGRVAAGASVRTSLRNGTPLSPAGGGGGLVSSDGEERRSQVYGKVPQIPAQPPKRQMSREERAALMPRALELKDRGLSWPQVAKELGVRTSQLEMGFREFKADGRCGCGEKGTWRPDPYQLRVHGEVISVFLCDECLKGVSGEV